MNTGTWRGPPTLTKKGQTAFWDAQAKDYAEADMTNDNLGELSIVLKKSREIRCGDIVTLGGAVGCRDPKVILEDMLASGNVLPRVIFNDLAERQVSRARDEFLKPFTETGTSIRFVVGTITDISEQIPIAPRRLLLGVYRSEAFFAANPVEGCPLDGYEEYMKNHNRVGIDLFMHWVSLAHDNQFMLASQADSRPPVRFDSTRFAKQTHKKRLQTVYKALIRDGAKITALQVIGATKGREGIFSSHWYTQEGILEMVQRVFSLNYFTIDSSICAKGMVLTVDPLGVEPLGIVTVLNNVLGNVLPESQYETLVAIRKIML